MKRIYKFVIGGKSYSFTTIKNAALLLRIPINFINFTERQLRKYNIDKIEIYDFKTQQQLFLKKEIIKCEFCGEKMVANEKYVYCYKCGCRLWKNSKYNAIQKLYGEKQT